ncbi:MAG: hypothetical protein CMM85_09705 [Rhodothermaceae bacterium]|nr:hypothetical protein [Rhodothermaceae bacterium]
MPSVRPGHDEAYWDALADRAWRRVRWRRRRSPDAPPEGAVCVAYGTPIHRAGTYYVRPAYTDGSDWLCQQAYDEMIRRTAGRRASRRSGSR